MSRERPIAHSDATHGVPATTRPYVPPSVSYKNGGSVDLSFEVGDLRPKGSYESESDEIVLIVGDQSLTSIRGKWQLTARDHNEVYEGEIDMSVADTHNLTSAVQKILGIHN